MYKNLILMFLLIFSLSLAISSAFITSNLNYKMRGEITTGGSVNLTNLTGGYLSKVAVGQPVVGTVSGGNYKICFGVFCTGTFEPQYNINFTGVLTYSNGTIVKNAPVIINIKYPPTGTPTLQFEGTNRTDVNGYFFVKIKNLPEILFVPPKILRVDINVVGDIEAQYTCFYNKTNNERCCPIYGVSC